MKYVPAIKKDDLQHGVYYNGRCRNTNLARWNADKQVFHYWRFKFGEKFIETIKCPEDDAVYDVFVTKDVCTNPEVEIPIG